MPTPQRENSFLKELARWGPEARYQKLSVSEAEAYTRSFSQNQYENFPVVTKMLPRYLRQPFYNVYAFCRWADDLGDEVESADESLRLLNWWREELDSCREHNSHHPVFVALQHTLVNYNVPFDLFHNLITAFERDQVQTRYQTYDELLDYCCYSANPVGRILLHLADVTDQESFCLSDQVCSGLQLINFWQDVARDYAIDRVYLPQEDLIQFDVSEDVIQKGESTSDFQRLIRFQVDRAERMLRSGYELNQRVPRNLRVDIRLFALGGLSICDKIRAINYRVLNERVKLQKSDLAKLAWKAMRTKL